MEQKRLFFRIAEDLEQRICNGLYAVGQKIPTEKELSLYYDVSRSVIREAILALEIKGFVEAKAGSGIIVTNDMTTVSMSGLDFVGQQEIGPFELLQARQLFEREAAALASTQITKRSLIRLRQLLDQSGHILEDPKRNHTFYLQDEEFHIIIAEATNNLAIAATIRELWQVRQKSTLWKHFDRRLENTVADYQQAHRDHELIYQALLQGSAAGAQKAMNDHMVNIQKLLMDFTKLENNSADLVFFDEDLPVHWPD